MNLEECLNEIDTKLCSLGWELVYDLKMKEVDINKRLFSIIKNL